MAKRRQTRTKRDNIDTPSDTSFLFPPSLVGKKLKKVEDDLYLLNKKSREYLECYLKTKNPDYLIKATRENNDSVYLGKQNYLKDKANSWKIKSSRYIQSYTVVWETIKWWIELQHYAGDPEEAELAKKYLSKISPTLIIPREESVLKKTDDGLVHVYPKVKGKHPYLTYKSPLDFIQKWDRAKKAFRATKKDKGYKLHSDQHCKDEDALSAIKTLGYEITEEELDRFNLDDITKTTASFLAWEHEQKCSDCKGKNNEEVAYITFTRLYKKALTEPKSTENLSYLFINQS